MWFTKKIFFIYIFCWAFLSLEGAHFHAILVGETSDPALAPGIEASVAEMKVLVEQMAHFSGLKLNLAIFKGKKNLPEKILQHIEHLQVKSDDVLFFYQNSHGLRPHLHEGAWPFLFYGKERLAISFEGIHRNLWSLNPRFLLSVADVCNNVVENPGLESGENEKELAMRAKQTAAAKAENLAFLCYKKLWLQSTGSLIVSSSEPFQVSFSIVQSNSPFYKKGGIFTLSFIKALHAASEGRVESSWEAILQRSQQLTQKSAKSFGKEQTPQFAWFD